MEILVFFDRNSWRYFFISEVIMDFKSLKPYVREVWDKRAKAGVKLPIRYLMAYQVIIVTAGEAIMPIDGVDYRVEEGDVLFIPPNIPYSYNIVSDFSQLHIYFDPFYSEISRLRNISSSMPPDQLPMHRRAYLQENIYKDYGLPLIFKPDNIDEYLSYWHELKDAVIKNNAFVAEIKMTKLLNLLHKELGISPVKPKIDHCELVRDYIDANFESIISLDEIASLYEINKFTISKKFTARFGESIIAYYNSKRLEFAKSELLNTDSTISAISESLNFTDVYTFSKFFKMHTGVSPTDFRRSGPESE